MRAKWVSLILVFAALLASVGCRTAGRSANLAPAAVLGTSPIEDSTVQMFVNGMSCPLCADNITKRLSHVKGVTRSRIDLGTGKVQVWLGGTNRPTERQLADAVTEGGFTFVRFERAAQSDAQ